MSNPYASPDPFVNQGFGHAGPPNVSGKVLPPAIALLIVAVVGLMASLFNFVFALIAAPPQIDPNVPEFVQQMQANSVGPVAAAIQGIFVVIYAFIIVCMIQMIRMASWTMALIGTILAMISFGSCCCILGLPFGIWSLVILMQADVRQAFEYRSMQK